MTKKERAILTEWNIEITRETERKQARSFKDLQDIAEACTDSRSCCLETCLTAGIQSGDDSTRWRAIDAYRRYQQAGGENAALIKLLQKLNT